MGLTLNQLIKQAYGEEIQKESYSYIPHKMTGRIAGKTYCVNCGLVSSKSPYGQWAFDKGCKNGLHPQNNQQRRRTADARLSNP